MTPFEKIFKIFISVTLLAAAFASPTYAIETDFFGFDTKTPPFFAAAELAETTQSDGYISTNLKTKPSPSNTPSSVFSLRGQTLPSKYDMRDYGYVTRVKNQGSLGTCWAFSAISNMESYILRHLDANASVDFSENHLRFSMSRYASDGNWLWGSDRAPNHGGNFLYATAYFSRGSGPISESDDPFENNASLRRSIEQLKAENGIKEDLPVDIGENNYLSGSNGLYTLTDTTMLSATDDRDTNTEKIKRAIYETNSVDLGIYWASAYLSGSAYYCDTQKTPNHAITLVGWDDDYSASNFKTTPDGDGAFLLKNSHGTTGGDSGYYWISYYDMIFSRSDAEMRYVSGVSTKTYDNIYQYDPLGANAHITLQSQTNCFAAIFNAKYGENIKGASFYTWDENCSYKMYLVKSGEDTAPAVVAEGYLPNAGYHMVEFDGGYLKGNQFLIIVELTCLDDGVYPRIVCEMPSSSINTNASANAGETYLGFGNYPCTLYDTTVIANNEDLSICLKAFTNDPEPDSELSGYVSYSALTKNTDAVFNLANNTGKTQNVMCVTAVYNGKVLENAFVADEKITGSTHCATVPFEVSSSDCVVKSMILYKDSILPVLPKTAVRCSSYSPSSPDFATERIFLKPGDSKCVNIIDANNDVTPLWKITSSDTSVVSVNGGTLTAGGTPGYAKITAVYGTKTVTAEVYVIY